MEYKKALEIGELLIKGENPGYSKRDLYDASRAILDHWIERKATDKSAEMSEREGDMLDESIIEMRRLEIDERGKKADQKKSEDSLRKTVSIWEARMETKNHGSGLWASEFTKGVADYPTAKKDLLPVAGSVTVSPLSETIGLMMDKPETILQMIQIKPTTNDSFSYLREIARVQAAAGVPQGELKPTSRYELERVDDRIITIAHLSEPIPRQWLSDAAMLGDYISLAMREGLVREVESQLFTGQGLISAELTGIENTPGVWEQAFDTDQLITARRAITILERIPIQPDGWAVNPADWETFELLQDTAERYLMGEPGALPIDRARRRLWGLPVGISNGVPAGFAYLGAWRSSLLLHEREVRFDWSEAFGTNVDVGYDTLTKSGFETNTIKFRAEGRFGLQISRPTALVQVNLS